MLILIFLLLCFLLFFHFHDFFIQKGTIIDWVDEVHLVTKEIYNSVKVGENLRYNYSYDHFGTVRTQLQRGGIRLAKVLNDIYD